MRICVVGKFPPIQGGVSMRTFWNAHRLGAQGHEVHVVTNAKEVAAPYRMHMRSVDWARCEALYPSGSVTVHWTEPVDASQTYIPMAAPFVSKLASAVARAHARHAFDVIFSHYMEPYGLAGHLAAAMTGVPHVVRMAGSDAGRLWHHPQFEPVYDHVLRSAEVVVLGGAVVDRAIQHGVPPKRIALGGGFRVPEELFSPDGATLDIPDLRAEVAAVSELSDLLWGEFAGDRPFLGICGKLGAHKGSFALLAALQRLKAQRIPFGLVALAHGDADAERRFRKTARDLGLIDSILQIPFLPHWRVPEFLRSCIAVCCLEQNFPIAFHAPLIPREVLLCGTCLVGSAEVIRKLPSHEQLPDRYGCVAIEDVDNIEALSERLAAIAENPRMATTIGARGYAFARARQQDALYPSTLEAVLEAAAARKPLPQWTRLSSGALHPQKANGSRVRGVFPTQASTPLSSRPQPEPVVRPPWQRLKAHIEINQTTEVSPLVPSPAARVEIAIAAAERDADTAGLSAEHDPLFRLRIGRQVLADFQIETLAAVRDPRLRLIEFDFDVSKLREGQGPQDVVATHLPRQPSYMIAFGRSASGRRQPLVVDGVTAQILELSDGTRTASEIAATVGTPSDAAEMATNLKWIESLFVSGLIGLQVRV